MPKPFNEVYELYQRNAGQLGDMSLQDFSKIANYVTQSNEFDTGTVGPIGGTLKKFNYWMNKSMEADVLPNPFGGDPWVSHVDVGGTLGEKVASTLGLDPVAGRQMGETLPRSVANYLPMIVGGALAAESAVPAAIGIGLTSGLSALDAYGKDGTKGEIAAATLSPLAGVGAAAATRSMAVPAINAVASKFPALSKVGIGGLETVVGKATSAEAKLTKGLAVGAPVQREVLKSLGSRAALYGAENVGAFVGSELPGIALTEEATLANTFTPENIILDTLLDPFMLAELPTLVKPQTISVKPIIQDQPAIAEISKDNELWGQRVAGYNTKLNEVRKLKDKLERSYARSRLNEEFSDILKTPDFVIEAAEAKAAVAKAATIAASNKNFAKYIDKRIEAIEAITRSDKAVEPDFIEDVLAEINVLTSEPLTIDTTRGFVEHAIATGHNESEAIQATAQTLITHAKTKPVRLNSLKPQRSVSDEALAKMVEAGKKGGRPKAPPEGSKLMQERRQWFGEWSKTEDGQLAVAEYQKLTKGDPERFVSAVPSELRTEVSDQLVKAAWHWAEGVKSGKIKPEEKEKQLKAYLYRGASTATRRKPTGDGAVKGPDGLTNLKFPDEPSARLHAEELNDKAGEERDVNYVAVKYGTEGYVVRPFKRVRETKMEDVVTPAVAREETPLEVYENTLLRLRNAVEAGDPKVPENLAAAVRSGKVNSGETLRAFMEGEVVVEKERVKAKELEKNIPVEDATVVELPAPAKVVSNKPASLGLGGLPMMKQAQMTEKLLELGYTKESIAKTKTSELLNAFAKGVKPAAEAKVVAETSKKVAEQLPTVEKDLDNSATMSLVVDEFLNVYSRAGVEDVKTAWLANPKLLAEAKAAHDAGVSQVNFLRRKLETKPGELQGFYASIMASQHLRSEPEPEAAEKLRATFSGTGAREAPISSFFQAVSMAHGAKTLVDLPAGSRVAIWRETGWMLGADGHWRFEIDDGASAWKHSSFEDTKKFIRKGTLLGTIFKHDKLYLHEKGIDKMRVRVDETGTLEDAYYTVEKGVPTIVFSERYLGASPAFVQGILLHEIQHELQRRNGFELGDNPDAVGPHRKGFDELKAKYLAKGMTEQKAYDEACFELYRRNFGEVESNDVTTRWRRLSSGERLLRVPYSFEPRAPSTWVVLGDTGTRMTVVDMSRFRTEKTENGLEVLIDGAKAGEVTYQQEPNDTARRMFGELVKPTDEVFRIRGIQLEEAARGKGYGKQMTLELLAQHPKNAWFYNSQAWEPFAHVLRALARDGLIELHTKGGMDEPTKDALRKSGIEVTDELGIHMKRITKKGLAYLEGKSRAVDPETVMFVSGLSGIKNGEEMAAVFAKPEAEAEYQKYVKRFTVQPTKEEFARDVVRQARNWDAMRSRSAGEVPVTKKPPTFQYTLSSVASRVLQDKGWTQDQIDKVALPFVQALKDVLPIDGVQFGTIDNNRLFNGKEVAGLASVSGKIRKVWLAATKARGNRGVHEQVVGLSFNLAHELGHHIEQASMEGLLDPKTQVSREAWRSWAVANQSQWSSTLREFIEVLPAEWRKLPELEDMMNPANVEEFEATSYAIWSMGTAAKKSDLALYATISPSPVRDWFRMIAKWGRDLLGAIKSGLFKVPFESSKLNREGVERTVSYLENIKHGVNEAYATMAEFSKMSEMDSNMLTPLKTSDFSEVEPSVLLGQNGFARTSLTGVVPKTAWDSMLDKVMRSTVYLEQLAKRYPQAANLIYSVIDTPMLQKSFRSKAMEQIFGHYDPSTGKTNIDPAKRPLLELVANPGRVNTVMSNIHRWQNENKLLFTITDPKKSSPKIAAQMALLLPKERQALQLWHASVIRSNDVMMKESIKVKEEVSKNAIGKMMSFVVREKHAQLRAIIDKAYLSVLTTDPVLQARLMGEWATELSVGDPQRDAYNRKTLLDLVTELKTNATAFAKFLSGREWYTPEIRYGTHQLRAYDANGRQTGVHGYSTLSELAEKKAYEATKGAVTFKSFERVNKHELDLGKEFGAAMDQLDNTMARKLRDALPPNLQGQADKIVSSMNLRGEINRLNQAHLTNPSIPVRRLAEGREVLNMVTGWEHYVHTMSRALSVMSTKSKMEFELEAPELKTGEHDEVIKQAQDTFENYLKPDSAFAKMMTKVNAVYHLGFNVPTHLAELSQSLSTVLPELVFQTGSVTKAIKLLLSASKDMGLFYAKRGAGIVTGKDNWKQWSDKHEADMLETLARGGAFEHHALLDTLTEDFSSTLTVKAHAQRGILSKAVDVGTAPFKAFADTSMSIYGSFARYNSRIAAILGYRLARSKGLPHKAAIEEANRFRVETVFGGGRASRPPEFYTNSNVGAILYSLQRYSLSWMSMYATHLKGVLGSQPKMDRLAQGSKLNHTKALATMSIVQFGLAGALGLPFAGALLAILEEILDMDIKGRVYNLLGELLEADNKDNGGFWTDTIMRGAVNALGERVGAPVDMGSRFTLSGTPGMNEFNGFDPGRVFGPTANVASSIFKGMTGVATGNTQELSKSVMPVGLRKAVEYFVNGDALTSKGTRLGLSDKEGMLYSLGFTPNRIRKLRDAESILDKQHNERIVKTQKAASNVAQLLERDPAAALHKFNEFIREGIDARTLRKELQAKQREFAMQVAKAHLKANYPKDLRESIAANDKKRAVQTLTSMNAELPPVNYTQQAVDFNEVLRQLGQRPVQGRLERARQADHLSAW